MCAHAKYYCNASKLDLRLDYDWLTSISVMNVNFVKYFLVFSEEMKRLKR